MITCVAVAVILTLQEYQVVVRPVERWFRQLWLNESVGRSTPALAEPANAQFLFLTATSVSDFVLYLGIPVLVIRLIFRERVGDYGIKLEGAFADWWLYIVMFAIVLPLVLFVSDSASFQRTYPYYKVSAKESLWPHFWLWEIQYLLTFLAVEFLFRGFMVHGTKHRFGLYAIFVMTVPYCMIHFRKPLPETFGSIIAGIALGYMSLKTRSIWMGTSLHMFVAFSMDMAALWRAGRLL